MNHSLINPYHQAEDYFFRSISKKYLSINDQASAYMTNVPVAGLNPVYIKKTLNNLDEILCRIQQFYDQTELFFNIVLPQNLCTAKLNSILNTRDFIQVDKSCAMALKLDNFTISDILLEEDEHVIQVTDTKLTDWILPLIIAFESTNEVGLKYAKVHEKALKNNANLNHFSLYLKNKPVSSITLSLHKNIARIDDVGTMTKFQHRGYATRLINFALTRAKKLGATHCFLESSNDGFHLYQKIGFETLFENNIYSKNSGL